MAGICDSEYKAPPPSAAVIDKFWQVYSASAGLQLLTGCAQGLEGALAGQAAVTSTEPAGTAMDTAMDLSAALAASLGEIDKYSVLERIRATLTE